MSVETTVFMSGNSEAVRIPKKMRLGVGKVWIDETEDSLIIHKNGNKARTFSEVMEGFPETPDWPYFDDASDLPPEPIEPW